MPRGRAQPAPGDRTRWGPSQAAGAALWGLLITLKWLHAQFLQPAADWVLDAPLAAAEESVRSVVSVVARAPA